jgi:hypothetical protein
MILPIVYRSGTNMRRFLGLLILMAASAGAADPKPMTSSLRKDGSLLIDGKPVFPYGFYISTGHTGDMRLKCVEEVAKIGGNFVHIEGNWHEDTRFLDRATQLGIWVVAGHVETEAKLERVRKFKDHPAIVAWTIHDDANTLAALEQLNVMNKRLKEVVPHRLTYVPLGTQNKNVLMPAAGFFNCSDFIGWEMYPVANAKASDPTLRATETQMQKVAELAKPLNRPYWILPQTFAWPGSRVPTPAEYRNLCYVGIINGARGVVPWSIYHNVESELRAKKQAEGKPAWEQWYLPDSPELWSECGAMAAELKQLAPNFLDGKRTKLPVDQDLTAAIWVSQNELLLVIANLSETQSKSISVKLPTEMAGEFQPVFPTRANRLKLTEGTVSGELEKAGVSVYRIQKRSP